MLFDITYEKVTPESAANGDCEESGFYMEQITLREAYDILRNADNAESNCYPIRKPDWITFYKVEENFATGEVTNMALHFSRNMTHASRIRVCKLFRIYGLNRIAA